MKEKEIGVVTHYFGKISVGVIKLNSKLSAGQKIHIKGAHDDFYQVVKSIQINHKNIDTAGKGQEVGIKLKKSAHQNDRVYSLME
ncbi:MAG: translation elongation factor-like protein [Candidatus Omnitrophica bacterium]|nr:translation elongation factor-like protein [Candidatus Omnitrophota bacterium]